MLRILMATDIAWWRRDKGAAQRIYALLRHWCGQGHQVHVLYLLPLSSREAEAAHASTDAQIHLMPPMLLRTRRLRRRLLGMRPHGKRRVLHDRAPEDAAAFRRLCRRLLPHLAVAQYTRLAHVLPPAREGGPMRAVDTHDVATQRRERLEAQGAEDPALLSEDEELGLLHRADALWAIQPSEAEWLAARLPEQEVVLVGHPAMPHPVPLREELPFRMLFLGSAATHNILAVRHLVEDIWPRVRDAVNIPIELWVAGSVCTAFHHDDLPTGVVLRGAVNDLPECYAATDAVVNPVYAGSGLKIKNIEALAHARPLITTSEGAAGLEEGRNKAFLVADGIEQEVAALVRLAEQPDERRKLSEAALDYVSYALAPSIVYANLDNWLQRRIEADAHAKNSAP